MNQRSVEERVDTLEHAMATLMRVPGEIGTLQSEFHGSRIEMRTFHDEMRLFQDVVASNFTRLETKVDSLEAKVDRLEVKVDRLETRVDRLDKDFEDTRGLMLALHEQVMARLDALGDAQK